MHKIEEAIISIHPKYSDAILRGEKTIELRRRIPNTAIGTRLWIYATRPQAAIVGSAVVKEILRGTPDTIWNSCKTEICIDRKSYDDYFEGAKEAIGIVLSNVVQLHPIEIEQLRKVKKGFHPPQVLARLSAADSNSFSELAFAL